MRKRLTWFFLGCLTAGVVAFAAPRLNYQEPLSSKQKHVLAEHGFEPMTVVKEIHTTVPVPVEVIVKERFEVRVPGDVVEVVRTEYVEVQGECLTMGIGILEIGGGCEIDVVGTMARAFWDCRVESDQGWHSERGPVLADSVIFEVAKDAQEPRWKRHWGLLAMKSKDGWGGLGAVTGQGRKWMGMVGLGAMPYKEESLVFSDGYPVASNSSTTYEPVFQFGGFRRW